MAFWVAGSAPERSTVVSEVFSPRSLSTSSRSGRLCAMR